MNNLKRNFTLGTIAGLISLVSATATADNNWDKEHRAEYDALVNQFRITTY